MPFESVLSCRHTHKLGGSVYRGCRTTLLHENYGSEENKCDQYEGGSSMRSCGKTAYYKFVTLLKISRANHIWRPTWGWDDGVWSACVCTCVGGGGVMTQKWLLVCLNDVQVPRQEVRASQGARSAFSVIIRFLFPPWTWLFAPSTPCPRSVITVSTTRRRSNRKYNSKTRKTLHLTLTSPKHTFTIGYCNTENWTW